jgi:hypothetical protein
VEKNPGRDVGFLALFLRDWTVGGDSIPEISILSRD